MYASTTTPARHVTSSGSQRRRCRPERVFPRNPPIRLPGESDDDLRAEHICRGID